MNQKKNNATDTTIEDIKVSKGAKAKKNNNIDKRLNKAAIETDLPIFTVD